MTGDCHAGILWEPGGAIPPGDPTATKPAVRACGLSSTGGERERAEAETEGIEYQSRRSLADRPVVAVKQLLAGVAVEPRGRLTRNVHFDQPGP